MKETKFDKFVTKFREVPLPIWMILATLLNYAMGTVMAKINDVYSNIINYDKNEFMKTILILVAIWTVTRVLNQVVGKVSKHTMLNRNYMKWITKLTRSKLATISSITTGSATNAINSIAMCDKEIVNCVLAIIPNIVPFIMLCKKEYEVGGMIPPITNIACIVTFALFEFKFAKSAGYKKQAKARSLMSSVTTDCIKNSQTVKYFNREDWSLNRQEATQAKTFAWQVAVPANFINCAFYTIMWIPSLMAIYFCWNDTPTVLYVLMMSYVIDNIGGYASGAFEAYTEKTNQLEILGNLKNDEAEKEGITGNIEINKAEFSYDPNNNEAVKFKIDYLKLEKGHRYCVTGKSGFGKSTLAKLLTGTFAPTNGTIPVMESIYMFAESEMFNTSIAENISLGEEYTRTEIEEMLNAFEISVDIDVYSDNVGENGSLLSTGQKQRINLCRTLFYARRHRDSLIVMDEVTAALDIKTSITCLEYLTAEFKRLGTTLVYISNKTDYLEVDLITDNIYVHRTGNVVTYDTAEE